jgi:integrase
MIFKKAVELDVIKIDPTQYATDPKTQRTVEDIEGKKEIPKFLEKEELALFLKTAKEQGLEGDYLIFLTLAYSGIRDGDLCALKKTDFDPNEFTLSIMKTYYNPTNNILKYTLLPPKTVTSERKIELDPIVFNELDKHLAKQNEIKMRNRKTYHDKDFVFVDMAKNYGYPIYIKKIGNRMTRLLKLAGLNQPLTPHSLRHTHVSLLAEAGVPLADIMDRMGHKDDDTTKNVYLHITKSKKKEASHKFGELMRNLDE